MEQLTSSFLFCFVLFVFSPKVFMLFLDIFSQLLCIVCGCGCQYVCTKLKVKSLSHVQLCKPMDCSPPGSSIHGILQARILAWVAIFFSRGSSWHRDQSRVSWIGRRMLYCWANREALTEKVPETQMPRPRNTWVKKENSQKQNIVSHKHLLYLGIETAGINSVILSR